MTTITPDNAKAFMRKYGGVETTPVNEMRAGVKLGIFAPGGVGKTTLAGTLCDSEWGGPVHYIDARGNPHVISSRGDQVQVQTVTAFKQIELIRQDILKDRDYPFKSVVLDNVTEMHAMDLRDLYGPTADIDWTKHSASTADLLQFLRNWCDLADGPLGVNVIFLFQAVEETRKIGLQEVSRSEIALNKALQAQAPGIVNWLGRLYIDSDKPPYPRKLDFRPIESMHTAKHQVDPNDEIAATIPMEIWNPSLAPIIDALKGGIPFPVEKHTREAARQR